MGWRQWAEFQHVLHRLLPHPNVTGYNLRQRAHNLTLPSDINSTTKQNFIFRMLFDDMYWTVLFRMYCVCLFCATFIAFVHVTQCGCHLCTKELLTYLLIYLLTYLLTVACNTKMKSVRLSKTVIYRYIIILLVIHVLWHSWHNGRV